DAPADFAAILGQPAVVELDLPNGQTRFFHGVINRFGQGERDDTFIHYRGRLVPFLWLLTRREQSRIFQQKTAKEILSTVLDGLQVRWDVRGSLAARDYCVQYRESDFAFASRLMEEEGIFYFFTHTADGHQLVLANTPQSHPEVPGTAATIYETAGGGFRDEDRIQSWEKYQEVRSGKYTVWDYCFEMPDKNL